MATKTTRRRSTKPTKTPEERAAEVDALHEQLNTAIASLASAEGWKAMLRATVANLGRYSANNTLLILAQCPHATQVRSFNQWKEHGRSVRKGETALRIFAPMPITQKDESGRPVLDENGHEKKWVKYKTVPVFDISQTEPVEKKPATEEPSEELTEPAYTLGAKVEGDAPAELWERLTAHIGGHGYTVHLEGTGSADGYTDPKTRVVGIQASDPEAHRVITLAHEGAHIECGHVADMDEYRRHRGRMECEAESVAYIVAGVAGLDAALTSVPYIAHWAGKTAEEVHETLAAASATVVRAARAILETTTAAPKEAAETGEAERAAAEAAHAAYQEVHAEMIETAHQREQGQPLNAAPEAAAAQR
ncbi:ArdC-like ssDNA-binding domain-containing protein [Streptomyces sp. NPDC056883]|uniref:ArdC-like ssDNA-binding domain-containing protein n=1 Tax=Streptomyces sp. NPDC056883 TaxID=3345959 RepID=UPI00367B4FDA